MYPLRQLPLPQKVDIVSVVFQACLAINTALAR